MTTLFWIALAAFGLGMLIMAGLVVILAEALHDGAWRV